ncbi:translation elongation factor Ts [Neomegalonema sp.]|uniref:translation elongation factor Ts n=1 Tax=Neomegalonema sp. TaxID=2039713 RepID=UPI00261FC02A|nr:translation elongation factor Ts [Neomegalonema sp.]MDD2867184.1 translation elongation factor Ts [Neomegalonema sp.]
MAEITAALVKELRERTGAGMMDCKKALAETNGDIEAAIDWLRSKGIAKAAKKADRAAAEGLVGAATDARVGALVEINSETDFVARNAEFQALVAETSRLALGLPGGLEELKTSHLGSAGKPVALAIADKIATIGENMNLRRMARLAVSNGVVSTYVHNAVVPGLGRIGVLVALESTGDAAKLDALGRQIAMHVAANNPASLADEDLDQALVEREKAVLTEEALQSGRPAAVVEKMIEGRIRKFYEQVVLLRQAFVMNPDITVAQAVEGLAKELGTPVKLVAFSRLAVGEGVEKAETDFAAEVAAAAKG